MSNLEDILSNTHTYWRQALLGALAPIHENDPQPGYYRMRAFRGGPWLPVAIWRDSEGNLKALRDGRPADAQDLWTWCCQNPIPYGTYVSVAEKGQAWPEDASPAPGEIEPGPAGFGHNSGEADPRASLEADLRALDASARAWLEEAQPIAGQPDADRAANFAERFSALEKDAEEARTREKRPILERGKAIDAAWRPIIDAAGDGKRRMKKALEPWLLAERERAGQAGDGLPGLPPPRAGTSGRRVGLRTTRRLQVTDREALLKAYRRDPRFWTHRLVDEALRDLAEADLRTGRRVPGAELIDDHAAA